jgi:hypothetical protein
MEHKYFFNGTFLFQMKDSAIYSKPDFLLLNFLMHFPLLMKMAS